MSSPTPPLEIQNEIVRAGAGAGKTTTLIRRIAEVAQEFHRSHARWPKIVVSTFTRKATQELRERLMVFACQDSPELLEFATSRSMIQISTIHGVLYRFLLKYGPEFGLDPGFQLVDGVREKWLSKRVLHELLLEDEDGHFLLEKHDIENLSTYFADYFQYWLSRDDLRPIEQSDIEAILKKKLAVEAERVSNLARDILAETDDEKWVEFGRTLQRIATHLTGPSVTEARTTVLREIEITTRPRHMKKNPKVSEHVAEAVGEIWTSLKRLDASKEKDLYWSEEFWEKTNDQNEIFHRVATRFSERFLREKSSGSEISLGDLELLSLFFLKKHPRVAKLYSEEWDYWMIDEYQDTSPIQVALMRKLIGDRPSFVVGDPQQSIYLFRGARSEVFSQHEKYVQEIGGKPWQLMKNYRSQPELLEFFNDFFSYRQSQFQSMEPRDEVSRPKSIVARIAICADENDNEARDPREEFEAIAQEVARIANSGKALDQICILGRVNRQLEELAEFLSGRSYPVHVHASSSFYERREIIDALALLKFIANPFDSLNLFTLLRSPWFYVEDEVLATWGVKADKSLWELIREVEAENEMVLRLKKILKSARTVGVVQAFWDAVNDSELLISSELLDPTRRREANLWKLYSQLKTQESEPSFNLLHFIEHSELVSVDDSGGESDAVAIVEPERINLMTIHASKGLQFDHVLIPHLDRAPQLSRKTGFCLDERSGVWSIPVFSEEHQKRVYSALDEVVVERFRQAEMSEQERLLYVALTRAKETVFLSWQTNVHAKSVLSRIEMDFSEGLHQSKNYSYEVQVGPWSSNPWHENLAERVKEIPALTEIEPQTTSFKKISVSQILESTKEPEPVRDSGQIDDIQRSSEVIQTGVQVHQLFEVLRYGASLDEALEAIGRREDMSLREGVEFALGLEEPPMKDLIYRGKTEWGFLCKWNASLIEGQVDLWGEVGGRIWIIDYKTGNPRYSEKAFRQLALYGYALSRRFEKPISLAVLYPLAKKVLVRGFEEMRSYLDVALAQKFN